MRPFVALAVTERSAQLLRLLRRLIDYRPAVDDIDEPARQLRAAGQRDEPQRHYHGLAEAGRHVDRVGRLALGKPFLVEAALPVEGLMACESDEAGGQIEGCSCRGGVHYFGHARL